MPINVPDEPTPQTQPSNEGNQQPIEGQKEQIEGDQNLIGGGGEQQEVQGQPEVIEGEMGEDNDNEEGLDEEDVMLENVGQLNPEVMFGETTEEQSATEMLLKMSEGGMGINQPDVEVEKEDELVEGVSLEVENMNQD